MNRKDIYESLCKMQDETLKLFDAAQEKDDLPVAALLDQFLQDISKARTTLRFKISQDSRRAG